MIEALSEEKIEQEKQETDSQRLSLQAVPHVVLGGCRTGTVSPTPLEVNATNCFGPRSACFSDKTGSLFACDTGHHRVLGWNHIVETDGQPADLVLGQPNFREEAPPRDGQTTANSLRMPAGICFTDSGLAVADTWNHRVLIWKEVPRTSGAEPDFVLGQTDFSKCQANAGQAQPSAATLNSPCGVAWLAGGLIVCDTGNRRVLVWRRTIVENGQAADLVLGQNDFDVRDENAGHGPDAMSMRWPHAACMWGEKFCLADAGNSRVMIWNTFPLQNGAPADLILGQPDHYRTDHNQNRVAPDHSSLNMPYGVDSFGPWLFVADTANSRIIAWHAGDLKNGAAAELLFGQQTYNQKGENRWSAMAEDSLCWPYGVQLAGGYMVVADTGNNRIVVWKIAM